MKWKELRRYCKAYENPAHNNLAEWEKRLFEEEGKKIREQGFLTKVNLEKINEWKREIFFFSQNREIFFCVCNIKA